jgi:hypothetical protein
LGLKKSDIKFGTKFYLYAFVVKSFPQTPANMLKVEQSILKASPSGGVVQNQVSVTHERLIKLFCTPKLNFVNICHVDSVIK